MQTPTRAGQGEDISPAQRSQSAPGSSRITEVDLTQSSPVPVYKNARLGLALLDTGRRHESLQGKDVEPAWKALDALRRSKTAEDLFLRASFDGLGTHLQIANWITKTLDRICQSADTHTHTLHCGCRLRHLPWTSSLVGMCRCQSRRRRRPERRSAERMHRFQLWVP